jgi:hypothetical protein
VPSRTATYDTASGRLAGEPLNRASYGLVPHRSSTAAWRWLGARCEYRSTMLSVFQPPSSCTVLRSTPAMTSLLAKRPDVPVVTFPDGIGFHSTHPLLVNVPRPTREPDRPVSTRVSVHPPRSRVLLASTPYASGSLPGFHAYLLFPRLWMTFPAGKESLRRIPRPLPASLASSLSG